MSIRLQVRETRDGELEITDKLLAELRDNGYEIDLDNLDELDYSDLQNIGEELYHLIDWFDSDFTDVKVA